MTTLIVSDLHLGSHHCQPSLLSELLHTRFDRLILNGDTVNNLNLKKLRPKHWAVMGLLREIARKRELILIRGNHDVEARRGSGTFGPSDVLALLLGVELREEYYLTCSGRRYLVLHGDRFDPTLNWPVVTDAAEWCYHATQKIHKKSAKWLKLSVKHVGGVIRLLKRGAAEYARNLGCQGVITGHTHYCDDDWVDGVHYLNSGCWVDSPCHYVEIKDEQIHLRSWDETSLLTRLGSRVPEMGTTPQVLLPS